MIFAQCKEVHTTICNRVRVPNASQTSVSDPQKNLHENRKRIGGLNEHYTSIIKNNPIHESYSLFLNGIVPRYITFDSCEQHIIGLKLISLTK